MVVSKAPTSTTNITGFFSCTRGSSFLNESTMARFRIFGSARDKAFACACSAMKVKSLENLPGQHQQVLENRPQAERREKRERAHNQDRGIEQCDEEPASHREGVHRRRRDLLLG